MATREIRLKLLLDNAQFLAAAGSVGTSAQSMGTSIKAGAGAASAALDAASTSARGVGSGMQTGSRAAQAALAEMVRASELAHRQQSAAAEIAARMRLQLAAAQATADAQSTAAALQDARARRAVAQAEASSIAERLRGAQAVAAQSSGMAALVQQERQVIPLRQAAEAAQRALVAAQRAEVDALAQTLNAQRALNAARAAAPAAVRSASPVSAAAAGASAAVSSSVSQSAASASAGIAADAAAAAQRLGLVDRAAQQAGAAVQQAGKQAADGLRETQTAARGARDGVASVDDAARRMSFGDVAKGALAFSAIEAAARGALNAVSSIPRQGITFLADTEVATLGMAGILQSMVEIEGRSLTFAEAQDMAGGSVKRLQQAAAETAASSQDLIETYRGILGPALAAGMSMQQVERFTIVGANAIKSMGLTTGQMVQELRDLTQGGITAAGSTLATALGLKDADIARAKASSEGLFSFLMNRMQGFASTSDAYTQTLKGGWEALGEQMTQASAKAMQPAADAAKGAIAQISEALKSDQVTSSLNSMGTGVATLINGMASGVGIVQQYGGAIGAMAAAIALVKVGSLAGEIGQATTAKMAAASASRLAAAQSALEASGNNAVTQSSRQQLAALLAEQRAKIAALASEQALTAAKLRSAEATAAQLVGQARLNALEQQVLPLRQQHAAQTAALEQAQSRLASATNAASAASRTMGAVVGALGGPIGIAITAAMLLVSAFVSARSEAEKLGKTKISVERVEGALNAGGKVDQTDAGRVQSALSDAKEKRDALLVESRKPASMADRSKGLFGGASAIEKRAAELAKSEADVKRLEALAARIDAAQNKVPSGDVNLRNGVSSKGLDEILGDVKTVATVKEAGAQRLAALEDMARKERALMVKRNASAAELSKFDGRVSGAKDGIQRDTTLELQGLAGKAAKAARGPAAGGDAGQAEQRASQIEKAAADLRLSQLKASAQDRIQVLDAEQRAAEQSHQIGLTGVEEYEAERVRIQRAKLQERMALIDAEIKAEESRKPKAQADQLQVQRRVVELKSDRSGLAAELTSVDTGATAGIAARSIERQRSIASETARVWQESNAEVQRLRQANAATAIGMLTDPAARLRAETAAQVAALRDAAQQVTDRLNLQVSLTTDPGQRQMLIDQIASIGTETSRAIELANQGLSERLKPGWASMLDGWRDVNRMMRESADQTMQTLVQGGERAFTDFARTGKLSIKALGEELRGQIAQQAYRQLLGGTETGQKTTGLIASLLGAGKLGASGAGVGKAGNAGVGDYSATGMAAAFGDQQQDGVKRFSEHVGSLGPVLSKFGEGLTGGTGKLGDFIGGLGSSLSGLFSGGGSAAGAGAGGGWGGIISSVISLFAADGAAFGGGGMRAFASGGSFTDRIVDRDTHFRYREGGREKLGLMGEAGPEAIMPLSGGGAQAIDRAGRPLGHLAVARGSGGRLSVVLDEDSSVLKQRRPAGQIAAAAAARSPTPFASGGVIGSSAPTRFAAGGMFAPGGGGAAPAQPTAGRAGSITVNAPMHVEIADMSIVQTLVQRALSAHERALMQRLRAAGINVGG